MPLDPSGRYKGTRFDPDYAAKKKARMEQHQPHQQHQPYQSYQLRYQQDYDQRPRDNGYNSRYERDARGWQAPASADYGDNPNNYTPRRNTQWDNHDRPRNPSHEFRPNNSYSTPRYSGPPKSYSPTSTTKAPHRSDPEATRIKTPPLAPPPSDSREMDAALKDLSNLVGIQPPASVSAAGNAGTSASVGTSSGPGGELSSLEKLKLFKAQVEASRAARNTDASSSTAITQVAESFLQRENPNNTHGPEEGEVSEPKSASANDKAQALKAKLKAQKQLKGASSAAGKDSSSTTDAQAQRRDATSTDGGRNATPAASSSKPPQDVAAAPRSAQPSNDEPTQSRPTQSYADAARDHIRRRSASPRGRASSPARYPSRTKEPLERRINHSDDRYADQPPEYPRPRNRRDEQARYDRPPNAREMHTPRPTRPNMVPAAMATPMAVSSTSINLVVKTLEVIKAQVEQLEVLIQPILDAQAAGGDSQSSRAPPPSPAKDMAPPPSLSYSHQRRSSYDSYEQNGQSSYAKRRPSYYDDEDGGHYRGNSTPFRGGYKKLRGGRGGKTYYSEGREGYKRY